MMQPAIPDVISIVASAYMQPIADLLENLLKKPKADLIRQHWTRH